MRIRNYLPGDEEAQARVYNAAAGYLPHFKPANASEVGRRYRSGPSRPSAKFYAVEDEEVVGYAVFEANGRISYPWCLQGHEHAREPLFDAVCAAMTEHNLHEAWAAYRGDWTAVLAFFDEHGFSRTREMINFVAETAKLPHEPIPSHQSITPLRREDLSHFLTLGRGIVDEGAAQVQETFFWENPYFREDSLFALTQGADKTLVGVALLIVDTNFADPTKLDSSMPCFRLGTLGTERERHKRVNGMFSCVFTTEADGVSLLSEAARRLEQSGLTHMAAQASSDQERLCAFFKRYFEVQGSFPIVSRSLGRSQAGGRR
jgi:hypothetical protein